MTFRAAMKIIGLKTDPDKDAALLLCKRLMVFKRVAGDEEGFKILSQVKEAIKVHFGSRCVDCGARLHKRHTRCLMHANANRFYRRSLKA